MLTWLDMGKGHVADASAFKQPGGWRLPPAWILADSVGGSEAPGHALGTSLASAETNQEAGGRVPVRRMGETARSTIGCLRIPRSGHSGNDAGVPESGNPT